MPLEALGVWHILFVAAAMVLAGFVHYLMLLGLPTAATVQTLNLCFSVGKAVQVGTWALYGNVAVALWLTAAVLAVPSVIALFAGMRVREQIDARSYRRWLRTALSAMALLLVGQYVYLEGFSS